jgi:hypothetical protein
VVVVETTVDTSGHPRSVKLVRGPSHAPDVSVAVVEMIKRAGPLPAPSRFTGPVSFIEIWLVHKDGRFQLDAPDRGPGLTLREPGRHIPAVKPPST